MNELYRPITLTAKCLQASKFGAASPIEHTKGRIFQLDSFIDILLSCFGGVETFASLKS